MQSGARRLNCLDGIADVRLVHPAHVAYTNQTIGEMRLSTLCLDVEITPEHVEHDATLAGAREIALFPPMTGG